MNKYQQMERERHQNSLNPFQKEEAKRRQQRRRERALERLRLQKGMSREQAEKYYDGDD